MSQNNSQLHQQPHMNATRLNTTADTTVSMQDDSDEMQEVIEVQILPQVGPDLFNKIDIEYEFCILIVILIYMLKYLTFVMLTKKQHCAFAAKYAEGNELNCVRSQLHCCYFCRAPS